MNVPKLIKATCCGGRTADVKVRQWVKIQPHFTLVPNRVPCSKSPISCTTPPIIYDKVHWIKTKSTKMGLNSKRKRHQYSMLSASWLILKLQMGEKASRAVADSSQGTVLYLRSWARGELLLTDKETKEAWYEMSHRFGMYRPKTQIVGV